ncbi:hypothetical protein A462_08597 [Pseudomonas sp. Ag1]|nr:hypothetical protein A462_08597 [Pseudomonas sp. Ag1]
MSNCKFVHIPIKQSVAKCIFIRIIDDLALTRLNRSQLIIDCAHDQSCLKQTTAVAKVIRTVLFFID